MTAAFYPLRTLGTRKAKEKFVEETRSRAQDDAAAEYQKKEDAFGRPLPNVKPKSMRKAACFSSWKRSKHAFSGQLIRMAVGRG